MANKKSNGVEQFLHWSFSKCKWSLYCGKNFHIICTDAACWRIWLIKLGYAWLHWSEYRCGASVTCLPACPKWLLRMLYCYTIYIIITSEPLFGGQDVFLFILVQPLMFLLYLYIFITSGMVLWVSLWLPVKQILCILHYKLYYLANKDIQPLPQRLQFSC